MCNTNQHPAGHFMFLRSSSCLNRQVVSVSRKKLHPLLPIHDLKEDTPVSSSSSSSTTTTSSEDMRTKTVCLFCVSEEAVWILVFILYVETDEEHWLLVWFRNRLQHVLQSAGKLQSDPKSINLNNRVWTCREDPRWQTGEHLKYLRLQVTYELIRRSVCLFLTLWSLQQHHILIFEVINNQP